MNAPEWGTPNAQPSPGPVAEGLPRGRVRCEHCGREWDKRATASKGPKGWFQMGRSRKYCLTGPKERGGFTLASWCSHGCYETAQYEAAHGIERVLHPCPSCGHEHLEPMDEEPEGGPSRKELLREAELLIKHLMTRLKVLEDALRRVQRGKDGPCLVCQEMPCTPDCFVRQALQRSGMDNAGAGA